MRGRLPELRHGGPGSKLAAMAPEPPFLIRGAEPGAEPGTCVRFAVALDGLPLPAFAIRSREGWRGYLDRCRHLPMRLDPEHGGLSADAGLTLDCLRHGARYDSATGLCLSGPCAGRSLTALAIEPRADGLWCLGRAPSPSEPPRAS